MSDVEQSQVCVHWGLDEAEHCRFTPRVVPIGCKCDPNDWGNPNDIPIVCALFSVDENELCSTCQHLSECHQ
jgi:hypothetical protein